MIYKIIWQYQQYKKVFNISITSSGCPRRSKQLDELDKNMANYINYLAAKYITRYQLPENMRADLVNDLWLAAYESLKKYRDNKGCSFTTFLTMILNQHIIYRLRYKHNRDTMGLLHETSGDLNLESIIKNENGAYTYEKRGNSNTML